MKTLKTTLVLFNLLFLTGCSFIADQVREKNRESYILNNPGAYDPLILKKPRYKEQVFNFLTRYRISHDWPLGFNICNYSTIQLPKSLQDGTWYGSYERLGNVFEYKDKTLQERRSNGYPERSFDMRYLLKDEYFRSVKEINNQGEYEERGYNSICSQGFVRTNLLIGIQLIRKTKAHIVNDRNRSSQKVVVRSKGSIKENEWVVFRHKLKSANKERYLYPHEEWVLPVADTGYSFSFHLLANTESLLYMEYNSLSKIFRHLVESVKIEKLDKGDADKARADVASIIKEIERYEAITEKAK